MPSLLRYDTRSKVCERARARWSIGHGARLLDVSRTEHAALELFDHEAREGIGRRSELVFGLRLGCHLRHNARMMDWIGLMIGLDIIWRQWFDLVRLPSHVRTIIHMNRYRIL